MIRLLRRDDLADAVALSTAAGWNQTEADWRRLLHLEPEGCFAVECDGRVAATATVLRYGQSLAWIGMVLTHRDYQRRGYARDLMTRALAYTDELGVRSVKLDATDAGRPLYLQLGFVDEQPVERWSRDPAPAPDEMAGPGPLPRELDVRAFGADRSRFLSTLGEPLTAGRGYVMQRPGSRARYLGPCVAAHAGIASSLVCAALSSSPETPWFWDLLPGNRPAVTIAHQLGFTPVRRLTRMVRGERISGDDTLIYAIAGFEAG